MIIRGATGRKIPHSRVFEDEIVYFIERGKKEIILMAKASKIHNYVKLTTDESKKIILSNQNKLLLSEKQIERWTKKCLCLVELKDIKNIEPLIFERQGNMDDWLILEKIEDVLQGSSIPYDYEKSKFK